MEYSISNQSGDIVATATSAIEAWRKLAAGRRVFGRQTVFDKWGVHVSETELLHRCANETDAE